MLETMGVANSWGYDEIKQMGRVVRKTQFVKLVSIEAVDEELNGPIEGFDTTRKAVLAAHPLHLIIPNSSGRPIS